METKELAKKVDSAVFPGHRGGPLEHVVAATAVALKIAAGWSPHSASGGCLPTSRSWPNARRRGAKVVLVYALEGLDIA
jgi:hypothetical protein